MVSQSNIIKASDKHKHSHTIGDNVKWFIYLRAIRQYVVTLKISSLYRLQFHFQICILEEFSKICTRRHVQEYSLQHYF